jgi:hypothetical protein
VAWVGGPGFGQQLLEDQLGLLVSAFAEVMVSDQTFGVGEVESRRVVVADGSPDCVVAVKCDRVVDLHLAHGPANVVDVGLEAELGGVHADHHEAVA